MYSKNDMSLRDYFSAKALQRTLCSQKITGNTGLNNWSMKDFSDWSYVLADAILEKSSNFPEGKVMNFTKEELVIACNFLLKEIGVMDKYLQSTSREDIKKTISKCIIKLEEIVARIGVPGEDPE